MKLPRLFHRHVAEYQGAQHEGDWAYFHCVRCGKVGAAPAQRLRNGWKGDIPHGWRYRR